MDSSEAQIVERLIDGDIGFKRLYEKHRQLERAVYVASGTRVADTVALGQLKKEKLQTKDAMTAMVDEVRRMHAR
jgi:uncharacterized protein YdcH (DUF465 family)